jgi:ribosomal protein S18 acetylase RimI-like enzyme
MHPLDNIIWHALTTRQSQFAACFEQARRFVPEVGPLAGFAEPTKRGYESLAGLISAGTTVAVFLEKPYEPRPGWNVVGGAPLLQMICDNGAAQQAAKRLQDLHFAELSSADSPEMLELTSLTKPGPFSTRTHELGTYLGIRVDGKLAAMAGERLKIPGFTEVSAVCTHPDHLGKGYAGTLMKEVMRRIRERGETPCLHVRQDNLRAIELYKKLGFRERRVVHFALLRKE